MVMHTVSGAHGQLSQQKEIFRGGECAAWLLMLVYVYVR